MRLLDAPGFEETPLELLDWVSLYGQTLTPIYELRACCGEGSVLGSELFLGLNSVVELKRDLHQQVGVISDLLSWLSAAKFGIGLPLHPPLQSHPTSLCC